MKLRRLSEDFAREPIDLGEHGSGAVDRVLYGDLKDDWRRVAAARSTPPGVARFLRANHPPNAFLFAEFGTPEAPAKRYRRGWVIGHDVARVDEPGSVPGMRQLVVERLDRLIADDLADAWPGEPALTSIAVKFPWRWREERSGLFGRRSAIEGDAPGPDEQILLRLTLHTTPGVNEADLTERTGSGGVPLEPLGPRATAEQVGDRIREFLAANWDLAVPPELYDS